MVSCDYHGGYPELGCWQCEAAGAFDDLPRSPAPAPAPAPALDDHTARVVVQQCGAWPHSAHGGATVRAEAPRFRAVLAAVGFVVVAPGRMRLPGASAREARSRAFWARAAAGMTSPQR